MKSIHRLFAFLVIALAAVSASRAELITTSWVNWTPPGSYSSTANTQPVSGWWGTSYAYAPTLSGSLTLPNSSVVNVTLSGEVVGQGGASLFTSGGPGTWQYWGGNPSAFVSANVPSLPPTDTRIALAGWGAATQTLTFSAPVSNITMIIGSLGSPGRPATWTFNQPVAVLSDGSVNGSAPLQLSSNGLQLTGQEASGVIQFTGTFTSFSWTVSAPEMYAAWNLGATSASLPNAIPEPGTWAAAALLVGAAGYVRWRKRAGLKS